MRTFAIFCLLLTSCASIPGVTINDTERIACESEGCTVWTAQELQQLIIRSIQRGIELSRGRAI